MREFYKKNEYITNCIILFAVLQVSLGAAMFIPEMVFLTMYVTVGIVGFHYITYKQVKKIGIKKRKTFMTTIMYLPLIISTAIYFIYKSIAKMELNNLKTKEEVAQTIMELRSEGSYEVEIFEVLVMVLLVSILISLSMQVYLVYKEIKMWK